MFRACLRSLRPLLTRPPPSNPRPIGFQTHYAGLTKQTAARLTLLTASSLIAASTIYADFNTETKEKGPSLSSLVRAYTVYSMCSVPALVDASPRVLALFSSVPGLRQITEAFVRITFFDQFVGADSARDALPLLRSLRASNKGVLFAYSVEVGEEEAADATPTHKRIVEEMLNCIDVAAGFEADLVGSNLSASTSTAGGRRTWVAIKMTALLPNARALAGLSMHIVRRRREQPDVPPVPFPGSARMEDLDVVLKSSPAEVAALTPRDIEDLRELYTDMVRVCTWAKKKGVKVIVDAEHSWYQPAIDAITLGLMREFNSLDFAHHQGQVQPLVYGTFQAYLRRTPAQLDLALQDARKHNYALGVKLVRGAYHPHELAAHHAASVSTKPSLSISPDVEPPVWEVKQDTDERYNACVRVLVEAVKEDVERCARQKVTPFVTPTLEASRDALERAAGAKGWFGGVLGIPGPGTTNNPLATHASTESTPAAPGIGVLFGTHNWDSCGLVLEELVRAGLAVELAKSSADGLTDAMREGSSKDHIIRISDQVVERVAIGQLYGMCDDLTEWIVERTKSSTPFVIKYVPYGALSEVMPYLSRRAIENKSILGGGAALKERERASREIWKRLFG